MVSSTRLTLCAILFQWTISLVQGNYSAFRKRSTSMLIDPPGLPPLPSSEEIQLASASSSLNLSDIQGDILVGMKKKKETFYFFTITDASSFKSRLRSSILPLITSTAQLLSVSTQPLFAVTFGLSNFGMIVLNITESLGDGSFPTGQKGDSVNLGDNLANWIPEFLNNNIHGVFMVASDTDENVAAGLDTIGKILGDSTQQIYILAGAARPGSDEGREHFGYVDGISQPAIDGFNLNPLPGQQVVPPGIILAGEDGDTNVGGRAPWTKGGSFMVFRQLQQLVPEFDKYLSDNALSIPGLNHTQGADLLGARMVGRWKSGAPIDLTHAEDDPALGADPQRNNNFNFTHPGFDSSSDQMHCPFAAHIRKVNPRSDITTTQSIQRRIMRASIPYGPEVTDLEETSNTTSSDRGLAFVAYQSSIINGFHFIQQLWANNQAFPSGKNDSSPGFDGIIGRSSTSQRFMSGMDPTDASRDINIFLDFVIPVGGEYFFVPPLSAIAGRIST